MLVAAVIGGFLVLGGGYGLYKAGLVDLPQEPDQQLTSALGAAERKIADLEEKLGDVTSAVSRQSTSSAVSALESKVSELESTLSEATSSASADLAPAVEALKTDLESLRADMSAGTSSGAGAPVDLKPLQDRLTALEDTAKSPGQGQPPVDLAPLEQRLSALEKDTGSSATAADKLSGSVSGLEAQLSDFKTTLAGVESRAASAEATAKAAQAAVSTSDVSLKTLADSQARATETLSSLAADIKSVGAANTAALESVRSDLDAISKRLAAVEATMGDATAREVAARALSVSALKSAVDSGRAYETELAAVKAGLPADIDLSALEAHAKTGVEPVSVLIAGFPPVGRKIYQTFSEPDRTGDVLDSLLSSARSIVSVRGLGDDEGTGPDAVLRRMETAVSSGDLKAALAAYQELPGDSQAVAADWAARAQARVEVNDLTDKASQEVLNALAGKDN